MKLCEKCDGVCEDDCAICDGCSEETGLCQRCGSEKKFTGRTMCRQCLIDWGGACTECGEPAFAPNAGKCFEHHDECGACK